MWSTVGLVTLICKVSHDIKSVQDIIPEFNPNQQCHSFRNIYPVLNCSMAMDVSVYFYHHIITDTHISKHHPVT